MNDDEKRRYLEDYHKAKEDGEAFFPYAVFRDALVALALFLLLIALAYFLGSPLEAPADPNDAAYTPHPEWYFLFLFQLLKYFPGKLEVIGVFLLPTLAVFVLFVLPLLDRSPRRYFLSRPLVSGVALAGFAGVIGLTILAVLEAPPPAAPTAGDPVAKLYADNCAACHGPTVDVAPGTNLHEIIAQGSHAGMPAWSGDLTTDQIDALAGFILSPAGSQLFNQYCGACHSAPEVVAGDPLEVKAMFDQGPDYPLHAGQGVPVWQDFLQPAERTALLNFLAAPDGQRLFGTNCSTCHGRAVAFAGDQAAPRELIRQGGLHLEMPRWRTQLTDEQIETLAQYVVDPDAAAEGSSLFGQYCSSCHGQRVPAADSLSQARQVISGGGAHQTMPVWGDVLTQEQLDALTAYTYSASQGAPLEVGSQLFAENCSPCHGEFGEGGPNPTRPGDIIAPISSAEYLQTRDDATLRAVISKGQPNFGMSPFGVANGGPLDESDIDALVTFLRAWEVNPPVELPPEFAATPIAVSGEQVYAEVCSQCHGPKGEGGLAPALSDPKFQAKHSDEELFDSINIGHAATPMIGWGEILSSDQIQQLVAFIRKLGAPAPEATTEATPAAAPSFSTDILPILQSQCAACHGQLGGWDASTYETVVNSGNNGPAVAPGDPAGSLLAQKLLGTQSVGGLMPPTGALTQEQIRMIVDWIAAGAPE